jgi:flagellar basal-body rod protein FlgC
MSIASTIAVSGLNAASLRLQVSASNVANAMSQGYAPLQVDQVETTGGGTHGIVRPLTPATVPVYDPTSPSADGKGMVASPNVSLEEEAVQELIARYTFAANALVVRADAQMTKTLIDATA